MSLWPKILRYENLGDRPDMIYRLGDEVRGEISWFI